MRIIKAGLAYFILVFGAGLALGQIRQYWAAPWLGEQIAELWEMPIMFLVIVASARWVVRCTSLPPGGKPRLLTGAVALAAMAIAEFGLNSVLRGISIIEYLTTHTVAGAMYFALLLVFVIMPVLVDWTTPQPGPER